MGSDPPRFNLPISCAALARSFSSLTSMRSSSSISLRQSAMSFMASAPRRGNARGPQRLYPFADCLCRALRIFFDQAHDRTAYHRSIRKFAHFLELVGRGNAKPHRDRQLCIFFDLFHQRNSVGGEFCPRTGDPGPGHGIDEPRTCLCDLLESSLCAGGCRKENGGKPVLAHERTILARFFWCKVYDQSAVQSSRFCISGKFFQTVAKDRVQVGKD